MKQSSADSPRTALGNEIAKIRSLPRGKRWEYIWEYYRLTFILAAFAIFFLGMMGTFLVNGLTNFLHPKNSVSIAFAVPDFSDCEAWMDRCLTAICYEEETEALQILTSNPHSDLADDFRINTSVWLVNGQPDIFVVNEAGYQYLLELEALADLRKTWPEELQNLAAPLMTTAYTLEISDTAFARAYGLSEQPTYLCMYLHGSGFQRALDIVEYILTEP